LNSAGAHSHHVIRDFRVYRLTPANPGPKIAIQIDIGFNMRLDFGEFVAVEKTSK